MVQEDAFLSEHKADIMENVSLLGLRDVVEPSIQPDYILPLGGARMANLDRCVTAHEVCMKYHGENIPVVALTGMRPINDIERRANSMDTFEFFLERYKIEPESRILLVTSCIYVPYQLMKFTDLAIMKNIYVDCIGNKPNANTPSVLNTASYLQELKATINAIYVLSERYF